MTHKKNNLIRFHYLYPPFYFPNRTDLKFYLFEMLRKEGFRLVKLNYIFCSDSYLLNINQQYLNHDTYTDIITFNYSKENQPIVSDIYISIDRVKANALKYQVSFKQELYRVIFHGLLHLCRYDDKTNFASKEMRKKENEYLNSYSFHVKQLHN